MMSIGSMTVMPPGGSPRDQAVSNLSAQVEAGEITAEDQDAMLEALDAIHAQREASGIPDFSSGPPSESEVQAKFETLLSDQVETGKISQEQADHLSQMFEEGELGKPANAGAFGRTTDGQSSAMLEELMNVVLEQLQESSSYDGNGDRTSTSISSLLADFKV
ncbi:MAG: hypothetical protein AAGA50_12730 [Pseudomonadota bacterium]